MLLWDITPARGRTSVTTLIRSDDKRTCTVKPQQHAATLIRCSDEIRPAARHVPMPVFFAGTRKARSTKQQCLGDLLPSSSHTHTFVKLFRGARGGEPEPLPTQNPCGKRVESRHLPSRCRMPVHKMRGHNYPLTTHLFRPMPQPDCSKQAAAATAQLKPPYHTSTDKRVVKGPRPVHALIFSCEHWLQPRAKQTFLIWT